MGKNDKKAGGAKGKGGGAADKEGGKAKAGAQLINVRHILVSKLFGNECRDIVVVGK